LNAEVFEKIVEDGLSAYEEVITACRKHRGEKFKISYSRPYVEAVAKMEASENQSLEVIALHKDSVKIHYDIVYELTRDAIQPMNTLYYNFLQTPAILEVLYSLDEKFMRAVEKLTETIDESESIIGREASLTASGFYGPHFEGDFACLPGTIAGMLKILLDKTDIDPYYKTAILASKSWGQNGIYFFPSAYMKAVEAGKKLDEAVKAEIDQLKQMYLYPSENSEKLYEGIQGIHYKEYVEQYRKRIKSTVEAAANAGVHFGNIVSIPSLGSWDVTEHISEWSFTLAKDDMVMAILEAVMDVAKSTLRKGIKNNSFKDEWHVLRAATGSTAAATAHILSLDFFTADMVIDLFVKRFYNMSMPKRNSGHYVDFLDMIGRGGKIIEKKPIGSGCQVGGVKIDLSPVDKTEMIKKPPTLGSNIRFSSLMKISDMPCLISSEPMSASMFANIVAFHKNDSFAPMQHCKSCAVTRYLDRHMYCHAEESI
jgi:hypothetical protein